MFNWILNELEHLIDGGEDNFLACRVTDKFIYRPYQGLNNLDVLTAKSYFPVKI